MAEGAPLLRAYTLTRIEGSNPFLSATFPNKNSSSRLLADFAIKSGALEDDGSRREQTVEASSKQFKNSAGGFSICSEGRAASGISSHLTG